MADCFYIDHMAILGMAMSKIANPETFFEETCLSWKGKTITPDGIIAEDDWGFEITFTDDTKFSVWVAQDSLHIEDRTQHGS